MEAHLSKVESNGRCAEEAEMRRMFRRTKGDEMSLMQLLQVGGGKRRRKEEGRAYKKMETVVQNYYIYIL